MQIVEFNREKKQYMNEKEKITKRILHKNFISNCIYTATIINHHGNFPEKTAVTCHHRRRSLESVWYPKIGSIRVNLINLFV